MTETLDAVPEEVVAPELSDEQVDKFFEQAKAEESGKPIAQPEPEVVEEPAKPEAPQETEEEKHAKSYQGAMREERARRQELQRELEAQRQQVQRMEMAFQKVQEKLYREEQPQVPSFDEDPLNNIRHTQAEMAEYIAKQNAYLLQQEQQAQQTHAQNQFMNTYKQAAQVFQQQTPDFTDGYNFLVQNRMEEFKTMGYDEQQATSLLLQDEAALVAKALRDGVNPAERIYNTAKLRGYRAASQQVDNNSDAAKQLAQISKNIQANRSLSSSPGKSSTTQDITLDKLSRMDDDEFDRNWKKVMAAG
jgi:hypothetical protein